MAASAQPRPTYTSDKYYPAIEAAVRDNSHLVLLPGVLAQLQHDGHGLRPHPGQQPQDERRAAELVRLVAQLPALLVHVRDVVRRINPIPTHPNSHILYALCIFPYLPSYYTLICLIILLCPILHILSSFTGKMEAKAEKGKSQKSKSIQFKIEFHKIPKTGELSTQS